MKISGVHHIAFCTNDMKAQLEFFTQVVGMKLIGLFPMHGAPEGTTHSFLEAGENCYFSFIQFRGANIQPQIGLTHALDGASPVAGGAVQHMAFNVDTMDELMDLRDRIRSHGYAVVGPLGHGVSQSMYLGAPEGILLEFATSENCEELNGGKWIEEGSAAEIGATAEDIVRFSAPPAYAGQGGKVPQPDAATAVYPTPIPRPMFDAIGRLDDEDLKKAVKFVPEAVD